MREMLQQKLINLRGEDIAEQIAALSIGDLERLISDYLEEI